MIVSILQMMGFPKGKPDKARSQETNAEKLKKAAANPAPVVRKVTEPSKKKNTEQIKSEPEPKTKEKSTKKADAASLAQVAPPVAAVEVEKPKKKDKAIAAPATQEKTKTKGKLKVDEQPVALKPQTAEPAQPSAPETAQQKVAKTVKNVKDKASQVTAKAANSVVTAVQAVQAAQEPVKKSASKAVVAVVTPVVNALPAPIVTAATKVVKTTSRLASITVPSMAQTIASTAAKSSYSQSSPSSAMEPVIPAIVKKDTKLANNWKSKPVAQLSDAELLAMPDAEYMNDVQLAAFRLKLSALKSGILNNAGETTEHLREDSSVVPDPADRATIEEEHALELRTRDRERKLLKKIEQSIARIDAGDYGYCDETGEPIGVGRLLARPTATLSLEAQQRRELKQKMFGD